MYSVALIEESSDQAASVHKWGEQHDELHSAAVEVEAHKLLDPDEVWVVIDIRTGTIVDTSAELVSDSEVADYLAERSSERDGDSDAGTGEDYDR